MKILEVKKRKRIRRKHHIRKQVNGTPERPRLTVYRSLSHIYAQIIDDVNGNTIVSASTLDKDIRETIKSDAKKVDISKQIGEAIAKRALEKNIDTVAFDRNGFLYHGRIKALAEGARKAGLKF